MAKNQSRYVGQSARMRSHLGAHALGDLRLVDAARRRSRRRRSRASTRSGCSAAKRSAVIAVAEMPTSAARSTPSRVEHGDEIRVVVVEGVGRLAASAGPSGRCRAGPW